MAGNQTVSGLSAMKGEAAYVYRRQQAPLSAASSRRSGTGGTGRLRMNCTPRNMSTTIRITPVRAPDRTDSSSDWVETHWSLRGIHGGELEGTAPTGKSVYVDGQLLSHIVDGKFVEEWVHWDTLGLLRQIGAVPPPPS